MERSIEGLKSDLKESEERNRDLRARLRSFEERISSMSVSFEDEVGTRSCGETTEKKPRELRKNNDVSDHAILLKQYDERINKQAEMLERMMELYRLPTVGILTG